MAKEALEKYKFDEVWLVPCGDREDKQLRSKGDER